MHKMGTSVALACFTFVLLAMNFATYFAEDEMTPEEKALKPLCENKAVIEATDYCFEKEATPLIKEIYSICAKNVGLKDGFSLKSLLAVSCVKGGAMKFVQVNICFKKEQTERKISQAVWNKEIQPQLRCQQEKATS